MHTGRVLLLLLGKLWIDWFEKLRGLSGWNVKRHTTETVRAGKQRTACHVQTVSRRLNNWYESRSVTLPLAMVCATFGLYSTHTERGVTACRSLECLFVLLLMSLLLLQLLLFAAGVFCIYSFQFIQRVLLGSHTGFAAVFFFFFFLFVSSSSCSERFSRMWCLS